MSISIIKDEYNLYRYNLPVQLTSMEQFSSYEEYLNWFFREKPARKPLPQEQFYNSCRYNQTPLREEKNDTGVSKDLLVFLVHGSVVQKTFLSLTMNSLSGQIKG
jgi:uncharacterized short protein YbdD (DUF466 family)